MVGNIYELTLTEMAHHDMKAFIKTHIIDAAYPKNAVIRGDSPRHIFIAIANFPGQQNFHRLLNSWVMDVGGSSRVIKDRNDLNKLRGQRFDLLWLDFYIGSRLDWRDVEYIIQTMLPCANILIGTYRTFILKDVETDQYEMYADLTFNDFMSVIRRDCRDMNIDGVPDTRFIQTRQPLQLRYLIKCAIRRLLGKDNN